ncbi:DUF3299 domain-containing protein [Photobacterium minamisatsumaniensis]|uniref:DUF3299 domain-containing protein n=1 Tax=Photobacterium minamisatsumaniensis TaxID=2910233 RepID=UPI003D119651
MKLNKIRYLPAGLMLIVIAGCSPSSEQQVYNSLGWSDLIPEDQQSYQQSLTTFEHQALAGPQMGLSQVQMRTDLSDQHVRIPGFVVPLELDHEKVYQFLLVPYHGACVHVPPPPANQLIHVYTEEGMSLEFTNDPIWIEGQVRTAALDFDVAQVGYTFSLDNAFLYDAGQQEYGKGISTISFYDGVIDSVFN